MKPATLNVRQNLGQSIVVHEGPYPEPALASAEVKIEQPVERSNPRPEDFIVHASRADDKSSDSRRNPRRIGFGSLTRLMLPLKVLALLAK